MHMHSSTCHTMPFSDCSCCCSYCWVGPVDCLSSSVEIDWVDLLYTQTFDSYHIINIIPYTHEYLDCIFYYTVFICLCIYNICPCVVSLFRHGYWWFHWLWLYAVEVFQKTFISIISLCTICFKTTFCISWHFTTPWFPVIISVTSQPLNQKGWFLWDISVHDQRHQEWGQTR